MSQVHPPSATHCQWLMITWLWNPFNNAYWIERRWGTHQLYPPNLGQTFLSLIWSSLKRDQSRLPCMMYLVYRLPKLGDSICVADNNLSCHQLTHPAAPQSQWASAHVRGRPSVTLCQILCAARAAEPASTCPGDHLLALTLCIIVPALKAFWPRTDCF